MNSSFFVTIFILPYALIVAAFLFLLRAAYRSALFLPLVGSFIVTAGFVIWGHYSIVTARSSTAAIAYLFLPFYSVAVAVAGFSILWAILCAIRFFGERIRRDPEARVTSIPTLLLAMLLLTLAGGFAGAWASRHHLLTAAATSTDSDQLRKILERALAAHDLDPLAKLAKNPCMATTDLLRIYDSCKDHLPDFNPPEYVVFFSLAQNPQTPADLLAVLASCHQSSIRTAIATNPAVPKELLLKLASDDDKTVNYWAHVSLEYRRYK